MERRIINLSTDNLRPEARGKPIEKVTFADIILSAEEEAWADEVYFSHQGRILCIKHRGMRRAERSHA